MLLLLLLSPLGPLSCMHRRGAGRHPSEVGPPRCPLLRGLLLLLHGGLRGGAQPLGRGRLLEVPTATSPPQGRLCVQVRGAPRGRPARRQRAVVLTLWAAMVVVLSLTASSPAVPSATAPLLGARGSATAAGAAPLPALLLVDLDVALGPPQRRPLPATLLMGVSSRHQLRRSLPPAAPQRQLQAGRGALPRGQHLPWVVHGAAASDSTTTATTALARRGWSLP